MAMTLVVKWWAVVLRGVAAIVFGVVALFWPPSAVAALVLLFGAYALVDGVFNLVAAATAPRLGRPWGWLAVEGVVSIVTGLVAFFWPGLTAIALVLVIAFWSVVTGIAEILAAIWLRRYIKREWLLALSGFLSLAFGVLLFLAPVAGAVAIAIWVGAYAIVFGSLLVWLGLRLRAWGREAEQLAAPGLARPIQT
jgi:uncharacterized membrane protein HdeD (DUF308 family)